MRSRVVLLYGAFPTRKRHKRHHQPADQPHRCLVKLVFKGTRGCIKSDSAEHRRHSSLLLGYSGRSLLLDCGKDWLGRLDQLGRPTAIIVTHAHPDHAGGLQEGWDRPVWATREAWEKMGSFPLKQRHVLATDTSVDIAGMNVRAFPVEHSLRAPAVGLRIRAGTVTLFYVPDVVFIENQEEALKEVDLFVGDGATLERPLVRKRGDRLIGHAPVRTQLAWCAKAGIGTALFTHCGSEVVREQVQASRRLKELAQERGIEAQLAHDNLQLVARLSPHKAFQLFPA